MFNVRAACYPANVKSVVQLLPNTMQHVLGNCLQCDSDFLFELVYICRKREGHKPSHKRTLHSLV